MSWDICIQDIPDVSAVADIPKGFKPKILGRRGDLIKKIQAFLPSADFSDPSWGLYEDGLTSIEFNMGKNEICESIMLHVRGGKDPNNLVAQILKYLGLKGFDMQEGEIFGVKDPKKSFLNWKSWKDSTLI